MRNMIGRKLVQTAIVLVACLTMMPISALCSSDIPTKSQVLSKAKELFGKPVKWDSHVFPLGKDFGVLFWFDESERLFRSDVSRMKYLKDEDAKYDPSEAGLSESDCDRLLAKLSEIVPIGSHLDSNEAGITGAGRTRYVRVYTNALVELGQTPKGFFAGFNIKYILPWTGTVTWTHENQPGYGYDAIDVGKERYFVSREEFVKLQVGKLSTFLGTRETLLSYDKHDHHQPM